MKFWRYILLIILGVVLGLFVAYSDDLLITQWIDDTLFDHVKPTLQDISHNSYMIDSVDARLEDIVDVLESRYFYDDRIDEAEMKKRAIKSYVDGLNDPFTVYLDVEENKELEEGLVGEEDFEGIGARVMKRDQGVMIEEVLK
jgi:C-terminal processing protease CtpA/Prc